MIPDETIPTAVGPLDTDGDSARTAPQAADAWQSPSSPSPSSEGFPRSKSIIERSFALTSPYGSCWLAHFYGAFSRNIFQEKVVRESDFLRKLDKADGLPELMVMCNFIVERAAIVSLCRDLGINTVHSEDGFFPHYETLHADPLGFCWESSLPRMTFRECAAHQRRRARAAREAWTRFERVELPPEVRPPFVLWPLQLVNDKVNEWDLNVTEWGTLLAHFRACLPSEYQLVIKAHPRAPDSANAPIQSLARTLPNTVFLPRSAHLKTLLEQCSAVGGANSSVLYEARLMFHKPVYAYARGWFTNHTDLFLPVYRSFKPRPLNRLDALADGRVIRTERLDDYTDWFLYQLLVRQIASHKEAHDDPEGFRQRVLRFSYASFREHGESIFD